MSDSETKGEERWEEVHEALCVVSSELKHTSRSDAPENQSPPRRKAKADLYIKQRTEIESKDMPRYPPLILKYPLTHGSLRLGKRTHTLEAVGGVLLRLDHHIDVCA